MTSDSKTSATKKPEVKASEPVVTQQFTITTKPKKNRPDFKVEEFVDRKNPVTHGDALAKASKLRATPLPDRNCCSLDGCSVSIHHETNTDTAFSDIDGFAVGQAIFIEEAKRQAKLVSGNAVFGHPVMMSVYFCSG